MIKKLTSIRYIKGVEVMMREWGKWLKRTTVIMMGAVLLGSTAGFSSQAGALPQTDGTGQGDSSRITVVSFSELSVEDSVRHVTPGCTEEEALRQLPSELEALVVIRTPQSAPVSAPVQDQTDASTDQSQDTDAQGAPADGTADTGNDGTADETPGADNATAPATTPSSGQKFLEMGENFVLEQVRMNVPVTWKLDVNSEYTSSGSFDPIDGASYRYVPMVSEADAQGNQFNPVSTLEQGGQLPFIDVLVLNQDSGNDAATYDVNATADSTSGDPNGTVQEDHKVVSTHGVWVAAENGKDTSILTGDEADQNFLLTKEGTYTIGGTWKMIEKDNGDGTKSPIAAGRTPVITIKGPGKFDIVVSSDANIDTTVNGDIGKGIIRVEGGAEVILTSVGGGKIGCGGAADGAGLAIDVESGSTVRISGANSNLEINGMVLNNGNLIVTKTGGLSMTRLLTNQGKLEIGLFDKTATDSVTGAAGVWYAGSLQVAQLTNSANGTVTIGGEDSHLLVAGNTNANLEADFNNVGTVVVGDKSKLSVNNSFVNTGKTEIGKKGKLSTRGLDNAGALRVSGWTVPEPVTNSDDGGILSVFGGVDAVNSGELEFGEGGIFENTDNAAITLKNSGTFRIADKDCLGTKIKLEKVGEDPDNEEAGGKFYLTGLTEDLLEGMPTDIAYTGNNQYSELIKKCTYKHTWTEPTSNVDFEVIASEWSVDICKEDGKTSAGGVVTAPGDYYVVWKNERRRKAPVKVLFNMAPASLTIRYTNPSSIPVDHPDLEKFLGAAPTEEELADLIVYELGKDISIEVDLAIYSRSEEGNGGVRDALYVTVKNTATSSFLNDKGAPGNSELNEKSYQVQFDAKGCATVKLVDIPTVPSKVIDAGKYEVLIEYKEQTPLDSTESVELEGHPENIYVVRAQTLIDLSPYQFQYTYGDEVPNPVWGQTVIVKNSFIGTDLDCMWYKTDNVEEIESGKATEIGREFPTKETIENRFPDWGGAVAGDYILAVHVPENAYSTGGVAYQKVNVARKDVALRIVNEPHKTYGTADADTPIEYQAVGLVKWPSADGEEKEDVLEGTLSRERDKNNLVDGVQGPDNWDSVGAYHIEKGTLDEVRNPNYTINFDGNYNYTIDPKTLTWDLSNMIVAQQDNRYKVYGGLGVESGLETPDKGKVGVTYERLIVNEDGTILEVVEPKLININDAVDINYALNYNPPANNEISIRDSVYRLKVAEGSVEHLSSALKDQGKTTIGIEGEMSTAVKALRAEQLNYKGDDKFKIYDVMVTKDGNVVEDIFQKGGLIVTIPYPEGTSSTTHKFVATHMITSEVQGAKDPGSIERFAGSEDRTEANGQQLYKLEQTEDGIVIKVTGLSPVAIAWAPINSGNPNNPDNPDNPNNPDNPDNPNNPDNPSNPGGNNGTNGGNNGTNGGNNGTNGGTNNGTNSGTNNGTNSDNKATGTVNKTGTTGTTNKTSNTTKTTSAKTGDTAQIAFYMIATLIACLLLILIICLIRAQFRKKDD
ncbi:MAG: hypothetical protein HFI29_12685 [Lachnospiraceae bacterium]|nr:hypothetical protein [Lachnospiraceae bacterium]